MKVAYTTLGKCLRLCAASGSLFLLGQCGLSDQQLTGIAQSVISTGLNTIVSQIIVGLAGGAAAA